MNILYLVVVIYVSNPKLFFVVLEDLENIAIEIFLFKYLYNIYNFN